MRRGIYRWRRQPWWRQYGVREVALMHPRITNNALRINPLAGVAGPLARCQPPSGAHLQRCSSRATASERSPCIKFVDNMLLYRVV